MRRAAASPPRSSACSLPVAQRVRLEPADLHVVAERIVHMQAVAAGLAHALHAHGGERRLGAVTVGVGDRIADLVGRELIELLSNEPFHDIPPYCPRRNASSSTMLANWTS